MNVRRAYEAIQRGDLTVLPIVVDILGEIADALDMLHEANPYEQAEVLEHLRGLDYMVSSMKFDWGKPNIWF